jgi:hypothetical protein
METYLLKGDEVVGPLSRDEIMSGLADGTISKDDYCAREGWGEWKRIGDVYKDRPILKNPPPLKKKKRTKPNKTHWRDDPVTERQSEFIRSKGKKVPKTKGEASDLISSILGTGPSPRQIAKLKFLGISWVSTDDAYAILDAVENDPAYKKQIAEWDAKKSKLHPDLYNPDGSYRDYQDSRSTSPVKHLTPKTKNKNYSGCLLLVLIAIAFLFIRSLSDNKNPQQQPTSPNPSPTNSPQKAHLGSTKSNSSVAITQVRSTPNPTPPQFPESKFWPDKVHVLKPITLTGSIAGGTLKSTIAAGTLLPVEITSDHQYVIIHNLELSTSVPIQDTDFVEIANTKKAQQK